jgi:hypothetical protein
LKSLAETDREPCPRQNKSRKPFRKNLSDAVSMVTEKPTHMQDELYAEACAGQIGYHASILAVASFGKAETERTTRFHFRRDDLPPPTDHYTEWSLQSLILREEGEMEMKT